MRCERRSSARCCAALPWQAVRPFTWDKSTFSRALRGQAVGGPARAAGAAALSACA